MRSLALTLCLCVTPVLAASQIEVPSNSLMRLPAGHASLQLQRVEVADHATLLIPLA